MCAPPNSGGLVIHVVHTYRGSTYLTVRPAGTPLPQTAAGRCAGQPTAPRRILISAVHTRRGLPGAPDRDRIVEGNFPASMVNELRDKTGSGL